MSLHFAENVGFCLGFILLLLLFFGLFCLGASFCLAGLASIVGVEEKRYSRHASNPVNDITATISLEIPKRVIFNRRPLAGTRVLNHLNF